MTMCMNWFHLYCYILVSDVTAAKLNDAAQYIGLLCCVGRMSLLGGGLLAVGEVNDLDREQFRWLFGNVVEKWPQAADHVYQHVPFRSALHISQEVDAYLDSLSANGESLSVYS